VFEAIMPRSYKVTWRLESPTAVMMPNMTQKMPPTIGCGMVRKSAPWVRFYETVSDQFYG
jgi:hypothetical protein